MYDSRGHSVRRPPASGTAQNKRARHLGISAVESSDTHTQIRSAQARRHLFNCKYVYLRFSVLTAARFYARSRHTRRVDRERGCVVVACSERFPLYVY